MVLQHFLASCPVSKLRTRSVRSCIYYSSCMKSTSMLTTKYFVPIVFDALRIAAAFPNILALPILIFPTLCEFAVVHDAFYQGDDADSTVQKYKSCVDQSNSMIFVYFFGWNFLFWVIGYSLLVEAGAKRQMSRVESHATIPMPDVHLDETFDIREQQINNGISPQVVDEDIAVSNTEEICTDNEAPSTLAAEHERKSCIHLFANALLKTISSPGFIAMVLGFITACIPALRDALFEPGGPLRFFGSAMESLGAASSSVGTIVVAASLVHQSNDDEFGEGSDDDNQNIMDGTCPEVSINVDDAHKAHQRITDMSTGPSIVNEEQHPDNNYHREKHHRRSSLSGIGSMVRRRSSLALLAIRRRKPTIRMFAWFIASRLIFAPALICALITAMDCGGILSGIPDLAKMVVIVNAGLPGAQLVVITLKSKGLTDSASIVAKVYLPSYLLSAFTIAAWTSIGLLISIPNDSIGSFCKR